MKISHKLCVRMDGTEFLWLWWFTAKNKHGNHKWAWVYVRFSKRMADSSQLIISLILTWSGGRPFWTFSQGWKSNRIWFLYPNCLKSEMHRRELQCGRISQWIRRTCNDHNIEPIAMLKKRQIWLKNANYFFQYWITQHPEPVIF